MGSPIVGKLCASAYCLSSSVFLLIVSLPLAMAIWFLIKKNVEGPAMPKGYLEYRPPYLLQPHPTVPPVK